MMILLSDVEIQFHMQRYFECPVAEFEKPIIEICGNTVSSIDTTYSFIECNFSQSDISRISINVWMQDNSRFTVMIHNAVEMAKLVENEFICRLTVVVVACIYI